MASVGTMFFPTPVFFRVIEAILHWICRLKGIKICRYELDNVMALVHFFEPDMDISHQP